ncbi:MAG: glycosyltransferase [Dehalococcoidia bacterium]|nr:glycosyltransferase [Dehalococcoidia bacterium]
MHRVDALVLYMGAGFLPAIFVAKAARKPILVIATGSGGRSMSVLEGTRSFMTRVVRFLEAATYRLCDVIVVYSRLQCGDLGLKAGDGRIVVAREHYVDHQLFVSQSLPSSRPPVVLFLGRFSREKGVLELLRAVPLALQRCPEAIFRFVGGGELEATLREEAARLGVVGSVRIEASVAHAEVPGVLNAARFLVLPSYTEGLPNVVLEAMACGTPVLVMPVGSIAEFIRDGETGFLLPDNTPAAIASSFGEVWGRELDAVAAAAQRLVRNEFTMERATEMYREVLVRCGLLRARTE